MLATQLNYMIHTQMLDKYTVIKVKRHICNQVAGQTKKVIIILDLEVVAAGQEVRSKIGNPLQIGSDGSIPTLPVERIDTIPISGITPDRNGWTIKARLVTVFYT